MIHRRRRRRRRMRMNRRRMRRMRRRIMRRSRKRARIKRTRMRMRRRTKMTRRTEKDVQCIGDLRIPEPFIIFMYNLQRQNADGSAVNIQVHPSIIYPSVSILVRGFTMEYVYRVTQTLAGYVYSLFVQVTFT